MIITGLLICAVLFLAYANGANDNIKGVATLYGSASAGYRKALIWATVTTLAGGLLSVVLAQGLVKAFSGAGLIGAAAFGPVMLGAAAAAAAVAIFLATILGMPTSTTHALTGALVGVGLAAGQAGIHWDALLVKFAQPLLLSPILAGAAVAILYPLLHRLRLAVGIGERTCICIGLETPHPVTVLPDGTVLLNRTGDETPVMIRIDENTRCVERYDGRYFGVSAQTAAGVVHWISSGAVCFARAVNDTPKIAALLLASGAMWAHGNTTGVLLAVTAAVVLGGLMQARRVAETMSRDITQLNGGQGLTANLVTAALVLGASHLGMPVSTTHVSCGSIFGISAVNGRRNWSTITAILITWFTTLPLGLVLGAIFYRVFQP